MHINSRAENVALFGNNSCVITTCNLRNIMNKSNNKDKLSLKHIVNPLIETKCYNENHVVEFLPANKFKIIGTLTKTKSNYVEYDIN